MRLHSVALATVDRDVYGKVREEDGRVFLSASLESGLSRSDFPELPTAIRDVFPSLGGHP